MDGAAEAERDLYVELGAGDDADGERHRAVDGDGRRDRARTADAPSARYWIGAPEGAGGISGVAA